MLHARALCCLAAGAAVLGTGCSSAPASRSGTTTVSVSTSQCGQGWTGPQAGTQRLLLKNTDIAAGEVSLVDPSSGATYADVEPIAPGTTAALTITLGAGRFAFRCAMEDQPAVTGPVVTIAGHARTPVAPVLPVTQSQLIPAAQSYQAYVRGQLPTLDRLTATLTSAVRRGDLAGARSAWLPAHLTYERLGAAYDAFGDLDGEINGLPTGLPKGVRDPSWTGFHRLEYGLWHGQSASQLLMVATALGTAVGRLGATFAKAQIDPLQISIRAHEITENALQLELTGETDYGSHSNLATVRANLDGTRTVLGIITPLLRPRYRGLSTLDSDLTQAMKDIDAVRTGGRYPALSALSRPHREQIDADISELSERLAPVASILEPRRGP